MVTRWQKNMHSLPWWCCHCRWSGWIPLLGQGTQTLAQKSGMESWLACDRLRHHWGPNHDLWFLRKLPASPTCSLFGKREDSAYPDCLVWQGKDVHPRHSDRIDPCLLEWKSLINEKRFRQESSCHQRPDGNPMLLLEPLGHLLRLGRPLKTWGRESRGRSFL